MVDRTDEPTRDPYACARCNCHHHTTEEHDNAPAFDDWDDGDE